MSLGVGEVEVVVVRVVAADNLGRQVRVVEGHSRVENRDRDVVTLTDVPSLVGLYAPPPGSGLVGAEVGLLVGGVPGVVRCRDEVLRGLANSDLRHSRLLA